MAKSPSVTLLEKDASSYTTTTSSTVLALVGYATKGPINTVTQVTSRTEFVNTFGIPSTSSPYASLAAYRAFNQTNGLLFYRVAQVSGGDSTTRALKAERVITVSLAGDTARKKVQIVMDEYGSDHNGSYVVISNRQNPVVSGDTIHEIKFYDKNGNLKETFTDISWKSGDTYYYETVINQDPDNGGSNYFSIDTYSKTGDSIVRIAAGTYYIGQSVTGDTAGAWATGDSWTEINTKNYDYRLGKDGIPASGGDTLFTNALATTAPLANTELWDFHVLVVPDSSSEVVANAAISLAEYRKDFIFVVDPPYGKTYTNVAAWHNGTGSQGRSTALNTSYAATYWPWLKEYNSIAGEYVWCPPSVFIAEKYLQVDREFGPWFAPAGDIRGKISAFDYETSPSFAEREVLYGDLNAVNPIVNFASKGLEAYGQKTLLRANSALNRVNVRRMVIYVKKLIKIAMDTLIFEPHTPDSWSRATNKINSILEPVRQASGLTDYRVTIDSTTNTADLIQQSIMSGVIQLVPVGTIEIVELSLKIQATGTTIE